MPPVIGKIDEDLGSEEKDEEESFRTKQLFTTLLNTFRCIAAHKTSATLKNPDQWV